MADFLKKIAGDLLTLEVNTIVKDDMTAAKMPASRRVALLELAETYRTKLSELHVCKLDAPDNIPTDCENPELPGYFLWRFGGEYSFKEIKNVAVEGAHKLEAQLDAATKVAEQKRLKQDIKILHRIEKQSSQLIGLFKERRKEHQKQISKYGKQGGLKYFETQLGKCPRNKSNNVYQSFLASSGWNNDIGYDDINAIDDIDLKMEQIALIRKASEIGVYPILMQTSIQIDGDVTSNISQRFLEYPAEKREFLLNMQNTSISTATTIWSHLFDTIGKLAGKAFSKIFNKGGDKEI